MRIPQGDKDLRVDPHKLTRVTGPTGAPRFVADSDASGHTNRTWACFLALNAADSPTGQGGVYSRRPRQANQLLESY
ncbi:MAG: hypothetical protein ACR5LG_00640 [Sodalis sp. (in: enterobacteria)]|uniref:hypothetical protein n=1 Tax=Sodalis sp. (in: enterobacteria) TaxID=1898979 RepID=UPI003F38874D